MNDISNVLAQLVPLATTETVLFQVALSTHARIDELVVCNRSASLVSFRMSISLGGNATQTKDYIYFDLPLIANNTFSNEMGNGGTSGLTLNQRDIVRVYASTADLTFTLFGAVT